MKDGIQPTRTPEPYYKQQQTSSVPSMLTQSFVPDFHQSFELNIGDFFKLVN
jgi:hypothetical protein